MFEKKIDELKKDAQRMSDIFFFDGILAILDSQPTIEPKRGEWIESTDESVKTYKCSCCGYWVVIFTGTPKENGYNYCPGCGANMRGEK